MALFPRLDPDAKIYLAVAAALLLTLSLLYARRRRQGYRHGVWLAPLIGLALLVGTELFLSRWRLQNVDSWRAVRIEQVYEPHPRLGWRPIPNSRGRHVSEGNFDATYEIDPLGRKAIPTNVDGGPTLHFFGDSYTFGHGVDNEDTALNVLAASLAKDAGFNVANYAAMGYGLEQMFTALDLHRARIQPGDYVIFVPTSFDLMRNVIHKRFLCQLALRGNIPVGRVTMRIDGAWKPTDLAAACHPIENLFLQSRFIVGFIYRSIRDLRLRPALLENADAILEEAAKVADDAGATFVVIFPAAPWECQKQAHDFDLSDLRADHDSMLEHCPTQSLRFPTDSHWSPEGHRWVADFLAERLRPELTSGQP